MTKEEGALIIAYCDENKIRNKQRLSELGVNPWSCYDAESNYTPKQEKGRKRDNNNDCEYP